MDITKKAAEILVACLENEGVEYIFGLPGEENIDVMDALLNKFTPPYCILLFFC